MPNSKTDQKKSSNRVTTNNLDNPHENQSSDHSGGHSPGRSDKTNSVDDESVLQPKSPIQPDKRFKSSDETVSIEEDTHRKVEGSDRGFEI